MPTVLLLDVSLSMWKPLINEVTGQIEKDKGENVVMKDLAVMGCKQILDHFSQNFKLEFTALIVFSSLYQVVTKFTRDFESIKAALDTVDVYDETEIETGLLGASQHIMEEWGNGTPCQIILITDGISGLSQSKLMKNLSSNITHSYHDCPVPFPFPARLNIACIGNPEDSELQLSLPVYQKLLELNGEGNLYIPESNVTHKSVRNMFTKILKENFSTYSGTLTCGNLSSVISLSPSPQDYCRHHDFEVVRETVNDEIKICGYLNVACVSSPATFSRHLVLPKVTKLEQSLVLKEYGSDDESILDEGKIPNFCVLLHGALKRENLAALCQLGNDWYGILYSWGENKKKSNLMLSIFEPGVNAVPWLGKLTNLSAVSLLEKDPYSGGNQSSPFPLKVPEKKSYAQNCVVWIRQGGMQSDIQKILRHARKLPEKQQSFYKELNRVRKAALTYGFPELIMGLSSLLERELYALPTTANPEAAIQLQHACDSLRAWDQHDPRQSITPLKASFD